MARDIAAGYVLVTERTFARMTVADLQKIGFEMERRQREIRGEQLDLEDIPALTDRNRRLMRLSQARTILQAFRRRRRM